VKISGFSYIRNGFTFGYPFLQSIQSILPVCDEFIIAVGDSTDGTKEAIINLNDPKIKIIDTVWDEKMRSNGKIFAQQANIALKQCSGDWLFHIQADEVIHENSLDKIKKTIVELNDNPKIEGILFDFLNFHGNYNYLNDTRNQHKKEIRVIRNNKNIYSYKDSQGFRKYPSWEEYSNGNKGLKLNVRYINVPVFHYSYVRSPELMQQKSKYFETFWHDDSYIVEKYTEKKQYDYYGIDAVKKYDGSHPIYMKDKIERENWDFDASKISPNTNWKNKFIRWIEKKINYRIGEYKNYKIVSK
jgi:hypothetical protein